MRNLIDIIEAKTPLVESKSKSKSKDLLAEAMDKILAESGGKNKLAKLFLYAAAALGLYNVAVAALENAGISNPGLGAVGSAYSDDGHSGYSGTDRMGIPITHREDGQDNAGDSYGNHLWNGIDPYDN
jgi:hypothetical protein